MDTKIDDLIEPHTPVAIGEARMWNESMLGWWYDDAAGIKLNHLDYHHARAAFQLACGAVNLARGAEQKDVIIEPTPVMDAFNRYLLTLLPFKPELPLLKL